MKAEEATLAESRIVKFRALEKRREELYAAEHILDANDPSGPCGQGPFTGNTRESRRIISLKIHFTPTRGGASEVQTEIGNLFIEAFEFKEAIRAVIIKQRKAIITEIEAI